MNMYRIINDKIGYKPASHVCTDIGIVIKEGMIYIRRVELWKVALHYFASRLSTLSQNSAQEDGEELVDENGAIGVGIEDEE